MAEVLSLLIRDKVTVYGLPGNRTYEWIRERSLGKEEEFLDIYAKLQHIYPEIAEKAIGDRLYVVPEVRVGDMFMTRNLELCKELESVDARIMYSGNAVKTMDHTIKIFERRATRRKGEADLLKMDNMDKLSTIYLESLEQLDLILAKTKLYSQLEERTYDDALEERCLIRLTKELNARRRDMIDKYHRLHFYFTDASHVIQLAQTRHRTRNHI